MFDDIIQNLEKWSQEQNLIEKTFESCQIFLQNSAADDAELFPAMNDIIDGVQRQRWKLSEIKPIFWNQALIFKHSLLSYNYIDTQLQLYFDNPESCDIEDLEQIGSYRLIVAIDGEIVDDYLEIYNDCLLVDDTLDE
jgi:hypothetical protein